LIIRFARPPAPAGIARFTISLPPHVDLGESIALSPDGRTLVYGGRDDSGARLYKRALDSLESVPIRGTEGASYPFFSPDGTSVGFSVERALKRVPLQGGAAITMSETGGGDVGAWLSDDTIVFSSEFQGLKRVPASGGQARPVTTLEGKRGEVRHQNPVVLPGERAVLLTVHLGGRDSQRVDVASLASTERAPLIQGNGARFLPTGHIVFQRQESLWVAPFDLTRLTLTGQPTAVVERVGIGPDWGPIVAVGRNGSLAYATGGAEPYPPRAFIWVDRQGREEPIDAPARAWWWPQVSPDGRRLGFHIMDPVNMDAWIYELDHGPLVRMTYDPLQDGYPLWTPDGRRVVFWSRQAGGPANLYLRSADLAGRDARLTTSSNGQLPFSFARDGKLLVFQEDSPDTGMDIGVVPIQGERVPQLLIRGRSDEGRPAMSHDGRWIAYQSNLSGRWEVYVQPFPNLGGRWQVSTQGGLSPIWHPNGRELFYRSGRAVLSVPVEITGTSFRHGNPKVLFEGSYVPEDVESWSASSYALHPDGQRFLMMKEGIPQGGGAGATQIVLATHWADEIKRLVPKRR
jgi:Tol biopolymer transport system component